MSKRLSIAEFIQRANIKHSNKYDYSKTDYKNTKDKICIICPKHGEFWQNAYSHLRGCGCSKCFKEQRAENILGFGINDYEGKIFTNGKHLYSYAVWHDMIKRCYTQKGILKNPTYSQCTICDDWKYFSKFKSWFDKNHIPNTELDKDLFSSGSKEYNPNSCCFLPKPINILLSFNTISIREHNSQNGVMYSVRFGHYGNREYLGLFPTKSLALKAYKDKKEQYIKELAIKYFQEGKINKRSYNALLKYKVQIRE